MSDIKVTQTEIDLLLNSADVQVRTEFGKCTVVTVRMRNGFILTESSACVDPANYDAELGKRLCLCACSTSRTGCGSWRAMPCRRGRTRSAPWNARRRIPRRGTSAGR